MSDIIFSFGDFEIEIPQNSTFEKGKLSENFGDDLDQRINTYLNRNDSELINSFILPVSLTGNFFDFSGLIFAHHIRLSRNLKCCDVKVAFYGTLELTELLRLSPLARILITENVFYIDIAKHSFEEIIELIASKSKKINFQSILNQIQISPPSNYDGNHHSVDNEFALIQWSIQNGSYESLPDDFKKEFDSLLYFKYLRAKNPLSHLEIKTFEKIQLETSIKILLIDDESRKGWKDFYEFFFQKLSNKIDFQDIDIDFKNSNSLDRNELISTIISEIKKIDPDIILLDLRLLDIDIDNEKEPNQLTGIKILEKIKEVNNGIQVIVTTASNKVWNFKYANQKGALDYIIKNGFESPEVTLKKIRATIEYASIRAIYLKPIYNKMIKSLNSWNEYKLPKRKNLNDPMHDKLWHINLKLQVNDFIKNAFDTINNDSISERFTISTLLLFRVIEMMNEFYIMECGDYRDKTIQYFFDQDNTMVPKISKLKGQYIIDSKVQKGVQLSTKEKTMAIYHKTNKINPTLFDGIHKLTDYRNNVTIHPKKRFKEESLEYMYESDFNRFSNSLNIYFSAILDYVESFK